MLILSIGDSLEEIIHQAFHVNLAELVINLIATIILILFVRFFFWNKVTAFIDQKKKKIQDEYSLKENLTEEALKNKSESEKLLTESKTLANKILSDAREQALKEKDKIISDAKLESKEIKEKTISDANKERDEIMSNASKEIVDLATKMASKVLEKEIDPKKYNEKVLEELDK